MLVRNFKDLRVCRKLIKLSAKIYRFTNNSPQSEQFGSTNQIRRVSSLFSANIAKRFVGATPKGKLQFCCIAYGPFSETKNFVYLYKVARHFNQPTLDKLISGTKGLRMLLNEFTKLTKEGF